MRWSLHAKHLPDPQCRFLTVYREQALCGVHTLHVPAPSLTATGPMNQDARPEQNVLGFDQAQNNLSKIISGDAAFCIDCVFFNSLLNYFHYFAPGNSKIRKFSCFHFCILILRLFNLYFIYIFADLRHDNINIKELFDYLYISH